MNKKVRIAVIAAAILVLCGLCGAAVSAYTRSRKEKFFDLSVDWEGGPLETDADFERSGWSGHTCEGAGLAFLMPDGNDGFSGEISPGQTVYFARVMEEDVDSPLLVLDTGNCTVAVLLGDTIIYNDCPEQDQGQGYFKLPMLEQPRNEPVVVELPRNYRGKVLTIVQSTDPMAEANTAVRPCDVYLYCSSAYEAD